jgi:hypothetical protein
MQILGEFFDNRSVIINTFSFLLDDPIIFNQQSSCSPLQSSFAFIEYSFLKSFKSLKITSNSAAVL